MALERGGSPAPILARAAALTLVLVAIKWVVMAQGWEIIDSLPLLSALMGGVVFTLAILLAGVLADFKESERLVGEVASTLRRLHWDLAHVARGDAMLARMRADLLAMAGALLASLRDGSSVRQRTIYASMERLDAATQEAAAAGAQASHVRTVLVNLANATRVIDRLEIIVETQFIRAGYWFAGIVMGAALAGLTLTRIGAPTPSLFLYAFAAFLLTGLFWLIAALDNPFQGGVRISLRQLEKLERSLAAMGAGTPPGPASDPSLQAPALPPATR